MASFEREKTLVGHFLGRLRLQGEATDPNPDRQEIGIDVAVRLDDGRVIGIQVTEIDPSREPGTARAQEKTIAKAAPDKLYGVYGQNDPLVVIDALASSTERKVAIAARHSFEQCDEVWLLICAGISEYGATVSTFVMTQWLSAKDMNSATDSILRGSKYSRCFLLPILGPEQAFLIWRKNSGWAKLVQLREIRDVPRDAYISDLTKAKATRNSQEMDRLCDEECRKVLSELRQG